MEPSHIIRDQVLQWMVQNGRGYSIAAKEFCINQNTVKKWVQRHGLPKQPSPVPVVPIAVKQAIEALKAEGGEGADLDAPQPVERKAKVKEGGGGVEDGGSVAPPAPPAVSRARTSTAANLPAKDREQLRNGLRRGLACLDSDEAWDDPKKAADAARAVQTILLVTPDILTFDERTAGTSEKQDDRTEKLAKALGLDLPGGGAE